MPHTLSRNFLIATGLMSSFLIMGTSAMAATYSTRALTVGSPLRFSTCTALKSRIVSARQGNGYAVGGMVRREVMPLMAPAPMAMDSGMPTSAESKSAPGSAGDYTTTNVQVEGVDEADMIKQDGNFVYHLTKNRLAISKVNAPTEAALMSTTDMTNNFTAQDMYVEGNRLMLIGSSWDNGPTPVPVPMGAPQSKMMPIWRGSSLTRVEIYDIADRAHPKKLRTLDFDGSISSSRLIKGQAYLVMNTYSDWSDGEAVNANNLIPNFRDSARKSVLTPMARCGEVAYFDRGPAQQYLAIASIPMVGTGEVKRNVILGSSETVYATQDSIYVARQDWTQPWLIDSLRTDNPTRERTNVYAFTLANGSASFRSKGQVPGHMLNQFSMDEEAGVLRIATTIGQSWNTQNKSTSNVYTFDAQRLTQKGSLTGIAPGEQIYSVRFVGSRAYMVTFKKIDPFFVIDLADAKNPKILGKLKIPGYSDYLHPMDANHVIGLGKDAEESKSGDFAWYQGLKMAIFDVTDVSNPKQLWKTDIGDRGSDSPALHDHHAFLYSPAKQILTIPVSVATISPEMKKENDGSAYGDITFQGAYVYRLTVEKGFELLGKVSHVEDSQAYLKSGSWFSDQEHVIERLLINRDTLISASPSQLQLHHLPDLSGYRAVKYPESKQEMGDVIMY